MEFKFNSIDEVLEFASKVNRLARMASGHGKISAIKIVRTVTGWGFKDSKEAVERAPIFASRPVTNVSGYHGCGDPDCGCE